MRASDLLIELKAGKYDTVLQKLYSPERAERERVRYIHAAEKFIALYGAELDAALFSVPGRSEILGNHTDHNGGMVLAASVDLDIIAVAAKTPDRLIRIKSENYHEDIINTDEIEPDDARGSNGSAAMITGICAAFRNKGYNYGGIRAYTANDVLSGSGLSSSAAYEGMVGTIINHFYNDNKIPLLEIAKAGKYAENVYFGKPCGLMDQTACVSGGFSFMDFGSDNTVVEKLNFSLAEYGYLLCIVDTGGNHSDLTDDYASVPAEMKNCAAFFGKSVLRETDADEFGRVIGQLRDKEGDRAVLRSLHYFNENARVLRQKKAITDGDIAVFLDNAQKSGDSSFKYLQNIYSNKNIAEQGLSLALAVTENLGITCRVHGGGFAGTIQAYVPFDKKDEYEKAMTALFGDKACMFLNIRQYGAVRFDSENIYEGK